MNKDLIISGLSLGFLIFIVGCMIWLSNPNLPMAPDQIQLPVTEAAPQ